MKIYIQSAGIYRDFNWKVAPGRSEQPCDAAIEQYRSLSPFAIKLAMVAATMPDGSYRLIIRSLYVRDRKDKINRPIYLNLCIEGLSEQQLRALACSYLRDIPQDGRHYWPLITEHYSVSEDDFTMDWPALQTAVEQAAAAPVADNTTAEEMTFASVNDAEEHLRSHKLSAAGVVLFAQQKENEAAPQLKVSGSQTAGSTHKATGLARGITAMSIGAVLMLLLVWALIPGYGKDQPSLATLLQTADGRKLECKDQQALHSNKATVAPSGAPQQLPQLPAADERKLRGNDHQALHRKKES